jgi:hypothetical protein
MGTINSIQQVVFEQNLSSPAIVIGVVVIVRKASDFIKLKSISNKHVVYGKE